jgi:hypothetical protein
VGIQLLYLCRNKSKYNHPRKIAIAADVFAFDSSLTTPSSYDFATMNTQLMFIAQNILRKDRNTFVHYGSFTITLKFRFDEILQQQGKVSSFTFTLTFRAILQKKHLPIHRIHGVFHVLPIQVAAFANHVERCDTKNQDRNEFHKEILTFLM